MRKALLAGPSIALLIALAPTAAQPAQDEPAAEQERDPETMAALERMGASLRRLNSFSVRADATREDVLTTGQKIQHSGTVTIRARRPDAFRIDLDSARQNRSFYFNGRNLTVTSPRSDFYATIDAPGTIQAVLTRAQDEYGLEFPLADLFSWGTNPELAQRITSAIPIATETIGGQTCEQHALRQEGVDWQIWIREGANALPCKIVITSTDDPSMPQYSAVLTWQPNQNFAADTFTYRPAQSSRRIAIARTDASSN